MFEFMPMVLNNYMFKIDLNRFFKMYKYFVLIL